MKARLTSELINKNKESQDYTVVAKNSANHYNGDADKVSKGCRK